MEHSFETEFSEEVEIDYNAKSKELQEWWNTHPNLPKKISMSPTPKAQFSI